MPHLCASHGRLVRRGVALSVLLMTVGLLHAAGAAPEIFAPGRLSGPLHDASPAFTPDGRTVYLSQGGTIVVSHLRGAEWAMPEIASFSGVWTDFEPAMSPDGTFLVFASSRPDRPGGTPIDGVFEGKPQPGHGGHLWRVARQGEGWGEAVRLPDTVNRTTATFAPSVVRDGSLYFMEPDKASGLFRLYRAPFARGAYQTPEPLPFSDGTWRDVDPVVAPDESFLIFSSNRPPAASNLDLFIVFRRPDSAGAGAGGGAGAGAAAGGHGGWGEPVHLGATINSPVSDVEARLGVDGHTLYFSSTRSVPVVFPRTLDAARRDLERMRAWDNGNTNIWRADLTPWLTSPTR